MPHIKLPKTPPLYTEQSGTWNICFSTINNSVLVTKGKEQKIKHVPGLSYSKFGFCPVTTYLATVMSRVRVVFVSTIPGRLCFLMFIPLNNSEYTKTRSLENLNDVDKLSC